MTDQKLCRAKITEGPAAVLLVCQLPEGHTGRHRCRLVRPGGPVPREWAR